MMKTSAVLNKLLHVPFEDEIAAQRARASDPHLVHVDS